MYLTLDQNRFRQYDFGFEITGTVFMDARRKTPADLGSFDSAEFRYFRDGNSFQRFPAVIRDGRFTARVPENSFLRTGIYFCNVNFKAVGRSETTVNEEIHITENAVG